MVLIKSILDTDWYKLLMAQVVFYRFPHTIVKYKFINRGNTWFPIGFAERLIMQLFELKKLKLLETERRWLLQQKGMTKYFVEWFSNYQFDPMQVDIQQKDKELSIEIEGKWLETIFWEVPLLAVISELYYKETGKEFNRELCIERIEEKRKRINFPLADFGTRRRFSFESQELLCRIMSDNKDITIEQLCYFQENIKNNNTNFLGTSNVHLAMKYNCRPIGTTAHECVMAMSGIYGVEEANKKWLENWRYVYGNDFNIALIDTFTSKYFLKSMGQKDLMLLDGLRQDSGDPFEIGSMIIQKWNECHIDSKDKTIVFSDNLNIKKAQALYDAFKDRTKVVFGIGTHLTNDCGHSPLNIVIKLDSIFDSYTKNWIPVIKLSDSKGKYTGEKYVVDEILEKIK